jgi:hypothetical protein
LIETLVVNDNSTDNSQATQGDWRKLRHAALRENVRVVAGMTSIADGVNVILETSCLPSADCNVWCRIVELYAALLLEMLLGTVRATAVTSAVASRSCLLFVQCSVLVLWLLLFMMLLFVILLYVAAPQVYLYLVPQCVVYSSCPWCRQTSSKTFSAYTWWKARQ